MSAMAAPRQQPTRKQSFLRHKIRESFRPSALFHHSEKDANKNEKPRTSVDAKRASLEETSWISRKRRKSKILLVEEEEPAHTLGDLKIDVGGFDDLKLSLDPGSEMYSLKSPETIMSPATVATTSTKETVLTLKPTEKPLTQKLNQYSPVKDQQMTCMRPPSLVISKANTSQSHKPRNSKTRATQVPELRMSWTLTNPQ